VGSAIFRNAAGSSALATGRNTAPSAAHNSHTEWSTASINTVQSASSAIQQLQKLQPLVGQQRQPVAPETANQQPKKKKMGWYNAIQTLVKEFTTMDSKSYR
jgi:hypothetical protein